LFVDDDNVGHEALFLPSEKVSARGDGDAAELRDPKTRDETRASICSAIERSL
jgi:hypothetical protein